MVRVIIIAALVVYIYFSDSAHTRAESEEVAAAATAMVVRDGVAAEDSVPVRYIAGLEVSPETYRMMLYWARRDGGCFDTSQHAGVPRIRYCVTQK